MRALLLLLLLLLLLCVTERKSLKTDVVSSTGQNTKKRGPRERVFVVSIELWFFDLFDSFFCILHSQREGDTSSKLLLLLN